MSADAFLASARQWQARQSARSIVPRGGFDERLLWASVRIIPRWQELVDLFGTLGGNRRSSDVHLMASLEASAAGLMEGVREAFTDRLVGEDVARSWRLVEDVSNFHLVGLPLAALVGPGAGRVASPIAAQFQAVALDMAAVAFVEQQALGRVIVGKEEPPAPEGPTSAKDRMRAMRERRRRGLIVRAGVDLTPGDVDLLVAYGFLAPQDRKRRGALDAAVSDFLFASLLTHNDQSVTQGQKLVGLRARIQAVTEPQRIWSERYEALDE